MINFSVCISVYKNDQPDHFYDALMSVYQQTLKPNDIVLVVDGPIGEELQRVIVKLEGEISVLNVIRLKHNQGHAIARQIAIDASINEIIAIMDSDDLSEPNRFEKQMQIFETHPDISVVGGLISEFVGEPSNIVGLRVVPEIDKDIKFYMKERCPLNFVTVMMKKSHVNSVGGIIDWYCEEDYYLWIRLALSKYKFYNLQETLVSVRVGKEMYSRRGGLKYFKSELKLQKYMYNQKIIGYYRFFVNVLKRFIVQVILPNNIRGWVFKKFARD